MKRSTRVFSDEVGCLFVSDANWNGGSQGELTVGD